MQDGEEKIGDVHVCFLWLAGCRWRWRKSRTGRGEFHRKSRPAGKRRLPRGAAVVALAAKDGRRWPNAFPLRAAENRLNDTRDSQ
jgi:hypothetical protein